jgi:poly-gamma-glutamate capsule biosynthesis protein CapA/YwtB (metallophosphatase superfamily)
MQTNGSNETPETVTLFLGGDVMTGRGIDQILSRPGDPDLYEQYVNSALDYVELAERTSGPIPRHVADDYVWGDARAVLDSRQPEFRFVNLETAITARGNPEPKGINYRMHPANIGVLMAGGIQACSLANNHILDWGEDGLIDTLDALRDAGIACVGAGRNALEASAPLEHALPGGKRILVTAFGASDSGIPSRWRASRGRPGINFLSDFSPAAAEMIARTVRVRRQPGDVAILSIHWGSNWGYEIPEEHRAFAHALIDEGSIDVVHGHSSHHPRPIEVRHGKLILYGCGDLINDYEGISGYEQFRDDLVLAYFPRVRTHDGTLAALEMIPFRIERFRLNKAADEEARWIADVLSRKCAQFGSAVELNADGSLRLRWT